MPRSVLQVRKWGNDRAVQIPAHIHRQLKWNVGDVVTLSVENGAIVLRKVQLPPIAQPSNNSEAVTDGDHAA